MIFQFNTVRLLITRIAKKFMDNALWAFNLDFRTVSAVL